MASLSSTNPFLGAPDLGALQRWSSTARFILKSAAKAFLLFWSAFTLCFLLFKVVPGDPARVILGVNASPEAVRILEQKLGLDRPLLEQYFTSIRAVAVGDLGVSLIAARPVAPLVLERLRVSGLIGGSSCLIALALSYAITLSGFRFIALNWLPGLARIWIAMPAFLSAVIVAILAGTFLPRLPLTGYSLEGRGWWAALAPATIVALYPTACLISILAAKLETAKLASHWRASRAYGLSEMHLLHRNGIAPALDAWMEAWFNQVSLVFFTTFLVELVFTIPGTGDLLLQAIQRKDFPLLQGIVLMNVAFFLVVRICADAFHGRTRLLRVRISQPT